MSLLTLVHLDDEQIEIVTDAVRSWCAQYNHDVNDQKGHAAMQVAVSIAMTTKTSRAEFLNLLSKQLDAASDSDRPPQGAD